MTEVASRKRIVIVDDSSTICAMLHHLLSSHPMFDVVGVARDAEQAMRLVSDTNPDIITIDLCMSPVGGADLLSMMSDRPGLFKAVISSQTAEFQTVRKELAALGADAFFDKAEVAKDSEFFKDALACAVERRTRARCGRRDDGRCASAGEALRPSPAEQAEDRRVKALLAMDVANLSRDPCLDIMVRHLASVTGFPLAAVNLIDAERCWTKAALGVPRRSGSRWNTFCSHTVLQGRLLVVGDAMGHQTFGKLPPVTGAPYIRAYAGAPILDANGFVLGALCIADMVPRRPSRLALRTLTDAARLVGEFIAAPQMSERSAA